MADKPICQVPGCDKPVKSKGYCESHYSRFWRYGDALAGRQVVMRHQKCKVDDCEKAAVQKWYCAAHASRFSKYGDPLAGGTSNGEGLRWLQAHVDFDGDECLIFPFGSPDTKYWYGSVTVEGKQINAHRAMCFLAHGSPPTPTHETCHSCGGGARRCVHPKHLRWGTVTENCADMVKHGTIARGEKLKHSKLTEADVHQIRDLRGKMLQKEIAEIFGVDPVTITNVLNRKSWAWLK